jgi:uncharacterized membrane-anchored protein YitT (DUF2179 family)
VADERFRREFLNIILLVAGIFSAAMGIKAFLLSSHFIDGGVTGVSMLASQVTGVPLPVLLPAINLPFVALGLHQMGSIFALRSTVGITGLALVLAFVPFPDVTPDLVLTAVFGGFFLGAGIGLAIRGGAVLDGTEIAALLISRRGDLLRVGDVILAFNAVLFVSAIALLGVEPALYSILTYVAAARTLDFVIHGIDEYTAMTIVSDHHGQIRQRIMHALGRGVTIYRGFGGLSGRERDILYCVVTRLEIGKVKAIVREIDPDAFIVYHALAGAEGGIVKTRGFH